jgi:hypothetical protein
VQSLLRAEIEDRFPGARVAEHGTRTHAEVTWEGISYRARLEMQPAGRVVVSIPSTDGFELLLRWNDRHTTNDGPRAPSFDDSFLVETNDLALAGVWLDRDARDGLLASRYVSSKRDDRDTALLIRDGAWFHEVSNDEISARRKDGEASVQRMVDMLLVTLLLAGRPVRWAKSFAKHGRELGGEPATRIDVGGKPALRVRRGAVDVSVRVVRRLGPGDPGRLRTIVSAHRHGSGGETLSLITEGLPRAAWPPLGDSGNGAIKIDGRARDLLDAAKPSSTMVRRHDVEIAFDGGAVERDRLGAAIELAAHWAGNDARAVGPYR